MPRFTTQADANDPTTALGRASDELAQLVRNVPHGRLTSYSGTIKLAHGDGFYALTMGRGNVHTTRYVAMLDAEYDEPSEPVRPLDAFGDDPDRTTRREAYHPNLDVQREAARFEDDPRRGLLP